jgi:hypothetical protein
MAIFEKHLQRDAHLTQIINALSALGTGFRF